MQSAQGAPQAWWFDPERGRGGDPPWRFSLPDGGKGEHVIPGDKVVVAIDTSGSLHIKDPRPGDPPRLVASSHKITAELGWRPKYARLQPIIESAWAWHQKYPTGYGD